jgi:hypothetical protein
MLTQHIALVPEAEGVDATEIARVSAALQRQVTRDLAPIWNVTATVDAFPRLEDVPLGYSPILLAFGELGGQGGVHLDPRGQPYAQVQVAPHWSLAASRACLEMLVNPAGSRSVTGPSLRSDQGPVDFLVDVCGPCGDARYAYVINGVLVSDFCTPAFYGAESGQPQRYTFACAATAPLQLLSGGHLAWYDPVTGSYWLRSHFGDNPVDTKLGALRAADGSVRELLNACGPLRAQIDLRLPEPLEARVQRAQRASQAQAQRLRSLLGRRLEADLGGLSEAVRRLALPGPRTAESEANVAAPQDAELVIEYFDPAPASSEQREASAEYATVEGPELQEIESAAPGPAPESVQQAAPLHSVAPAPVRSVPPPLRTSATSTVSLAPVTLSSAPAGPPKRSFAPVYAGFAIAVLLVAFFVGTQRPPRQAAAGGAPQARVTQPQPLPSLPPSAPEPVVDPAASQAVPSVESPLPSRVGRVASSAPASAKRPTGTLRARRAPKRAADTKAIAPVEPKPEPPDAVAATPTPPAPPETVQTAPRPLALEDLFETRR